MAEVKHFKVTELPEILDADAIYFVNDGTSIKEYVTDSLGVAKYVNSSVGVALSGYFDNGDEEAEVSNEAPRIGDVIHNILDDYTGEIISFSKITGVTDEDVDGVIITKKGAEYFKRNYSGSVSIKSFGATGDAGTNDAPAINKAIEVIGQLGGGEVVIPIGTFEVWPAVSGGDAVVIGYDNVSLIGEDKYKSILSFKVFGGGDPAGNTPGTNFEVISGAVHRGDGIFITGGILYGPGAMENPRTGVRLLNFTLDGNAGFQSGLYSLTGGTVPPWPANPANGNGWDLTNKGIHVEADKHHTDMLIRDVIVKRFRGEIIYGQCENIEINRCEIADGNSSLLSMGRTTMNVTNCIIHTGLNGGECSTYGYNQIFTNCEFYNVVYGLVITQADGLKEGKVIISNNRFLDCHSAALYSTGFTANLDFFNNKIQDCGVGGAGVYLSEQFGSAPQKSNFYRNDFIADTKNPAATFILLNDLVNISVYENKSTRTDYARDNNFNTIASVTWGTNPNLSNVVIKDNYWEGAVRFPHNYQGTTDTTSKTPLFINNKFDPGTRYIFEQYIEDANYAVRSYGENIYLSGLGGYGNNISPFAATNSLRTAGVPEGQIMRIYGNASGPVMFPQKGTGFILKQPRTIGTFTLVLQMKNGVWNEIGFEPMTTPLNSTEPTSLDLIPAGRGVNADGTVLRGYGSKVVIPTATAATAFATWADFPYDQFVFVKLSAVQSVVTGGTFKLAGAVNFAPGGTGGIIVFFVPNGSTYAYEVVRFANDAGIPATPATILNQSTAKQTAAAWFDNLKLGAGTFDSVYEFDMTGDARFTGSSTEALALWSTSNLYRLLIYNSTAATGGAQLNNSPQLRFSSSVWNGGWGARTQSAYMQLVAVSGGNPPNMKLSFFVGEDASGVTEKMSISNLGVFSINGGANFLGLTAADANSVIIGNQTRATNSVPQNSNKLLLAGESYTSGWGPVGANAYLQIRNTTNSVATPVDRLCFFLSQHNGSGGVTYTERFAMSNLGEFIIVTAPGTSAGTFEILTRNTSTGVVEKIASGAVVLATGNQTIAGEKSFTDGIGAGVGVSSFAFLTIAAGTTARAGIQFGTSGAALLTSPVNGTIEFVGGEVYQTSGGVRYKLQKVGAVPATATSTGVAGTIAYDATHFYVCVATDTWVRTSLATW